VQEREGGILDFLPGEAKRLAVVGHRKSLAERLPKEGRGRNRQLGQQKCP
jgi:hypothetical protein